jgi:hypothetical protein
LKVSGQSDETTSISGDNLVVGESQAVRQLSINGKYEGTNGTAVVEVIDSSKTSIKEKFGITTAITEGMSEEQKRAAAVKAVTGTFNALHKFIQAGGLNNEQTKDIIKLGDWIDLEGGLTVEAYGHGSLTGAFSLNNDDIAPGGSQSKILRLIVVGINSFHSKRGAKNEAGVPTYNGEEIGNYENIANDGTPHVVFQFKSLPTVRRMNAGSTIDGGYPATEMRQYLTPVKGYPGSGKFLQGLTEAGVPNGVLWDPVRVLPIGNYETEDINDLLWLPTEFEIFGKKPSSYATISGETQKNQARLEYYYNVNENDAKLLLKKYAGIPYNDFKSYYLGSLGISSASYAIIILPNGESTAGVLIGDVGIAPAFCVY